VSSVGKTQLTIAESASKLAVGMPTLQSVKYDSDGAKTQLVLVLSHPAKKMTAAGCSDLITIKDSTNVTTSIAADGDVSCEFSANMTQLTYTLGTNHTFTDGENRCTVYVYYARALIVMFCFAGTQINLVAVATSPSTAGWNNSIGLSSNSDKNEIVFYPLGATARGAAGTFVPVTRPTLVSAKFGVDVNVTKTQLTLAFSAPARKPLANSSCADMLVVDGVSNVVTALGAGATCELAANGLSMVFNLGSNHTLKNGVKVTLPSANGKALPIASAYKPGYDQTAEITLSSPDAMTVVEPTILSAKFMTVTTKPAVVVELTHPARKARSNTTCVEMLSITDSKGAAVVGVLNSTVCTVNGTTVTVVYDSAATIKSGMIVSMALLHYKNISDFIYSPKSGFLVNVAKSNGLVLSTSAVGSELYFVAANAGVVIAQPTITVATYSAYQVTSNSTNSTMNATTSWATAISANFSAHAAIPVPNLNCSDAVVITDGDGTVLNTSAVVNNDSCYFDGVVAYVALLQGISLKQGM
jgi:hypothetical protein